MIIEFNNKIKPNFNQYANYNDFSNEHTFVYFNSKLLEDCFEKDDYFGSSVDCIAVSYSYEPIFNSIYRNIFRHVNNYIYERFGVTDEMDNGDWRFDTE